MHNARQAANYVVCGQVVDPQVQSSHQASTPIKCTLNSRPPVLFNFIITDSPAQQRMLRINECLI